MTTREDKNSADTNLIAVLDDIEDFLEDQQDVVDGDDSEPRPNKAMSLLSALAEARTAWARAGLRSSLARAEPYDSFGLALREILGADDDEAIIDAATRVAALARSVVARSDFHGWRGLMLESVVCLRRAIESDDGLDGKQGKDMIEAIESGIKSLDAAIATIPAATAMPDSTTRDLLFRARETLNIGCAFIGISEAERANWIGHAVMVSAQITEALDALPRLASARTLKNATLAELEQANEVPPTTACEECGKSPDQPCELKVFEARCPRNIEEMFRRSMDEVGLAYVPDMHRLGLWRQALDIFAARIYARSASAMPDYINLCTTPGCGVPALDQPKSMGPSVCAKHDPKR